MNERITPTEAAKQLNMSVVNLRKLVENGKLDIGYCIRNGKRATFYLYKSLVDEEARRLGINKSI